MRVFRKFFVGSVFACVVAAPAVAQRLPETGSSPASGAFTGGDAQSLAGDSAKQVKLAASEFSAWQVSGGATAAYPKRGVVGATRGTARQPEMLREVVPGPIWVIGMSLIGFSLVARRRRESAPGAGRGLPAPEPVR